VLGPQLDLFGDRHLRLEHARRALAEGRLADACSELLRLRRCYPEDPTIATEVEAAHTLMQRLEDIDAAPAGERSHALLDLARGAAAGLRAWLLRRAAFELQQTAGPTALVDGKPASALFLEAGDPHTAWSAAAEAVGDSSRTRFAGYLADVEHHLGQHSRARARYREALADDPFDIDWDALADDDVKALPDIARTELELDDGVAWAAPVGVVLKVLPVGGPPAARPLAAVAGQRHVAVEQAREFLRALLRASHDRGAAIDARRQMKRLAPQLLAAHLEAARRDA
jgi:tetratricopeptide (TPR) repeat protein